MRPFFTTLALTLTLACDPDAAHDADDAPEQVTPLAGSLTKPEPGKQAPPTPVEVMPNAEAAFAETLKLIDDQYFDPAVPRDALYSGATAGLLASLYQVGDHPVNTLLNPRELEELTAGTAGAVVGIGVQIANTNGVVTIIWVIPGSPADKAGLQPGDRILGIDEVRLKGLELVAVVDKIRGVPGSELDLFVQRDTEEWHVKLTRATVPISNLGLPLRSGDVGYLALRGFAESTPAELDAAISDLRSEGARSLILDLRDCPGGLLDAAVAVAGRFLPKDRSIAAIAGRDDASKKFATASDGPYSDADALPLVLLVGPHTASGAEILADALQTHGRATLVGQPTLGKDSVEHVHKLSNGWGLKLTSGRLLGAAGQPRLGKGVQPRLPVPAGDEPAPTPTNLDDDADAALSVARAWLRERSH